MSRHFVSVAILWAILTAIGEGLALLDLFPVVGSTEAEDFDRIFRILLFMGIPVFCFVIAVVIYAVWSFRIKGDPDSDGPAYRGTGNVPRFWIAITSSLAVLTMIFPGLTGLAELQKDKEGYGWGSEEGELVIRVTGFRWSWTMEYPEQGIQVSTARGRELVLPVDSTVKFEIESTDVVHSFWIPAFRMKVDAIPGRTTFITVEPTELGSFEEDAAYRVQCAELCGLDHAAMQFPVRVVSHEEFEQWVASQAGGE